MSNRNVINTESQTGNNQDPYVRTSNPDKDKFLFVFTPNNLAIECCCGCSLKTGVQIIAILFLTAALSNFFTALSMKSFISLIISGLAFILYFTAGVCILYSTLRSDFIYAYTGYLIIATIFLISLLDNIIVIMLIFLGLYHPFDNQSPFTVGLIMVLAVTITMSINLYLVWILFSYCIHLKHRRHVLISGYILYKYQDSAPQGQSAVSPVEVRPIV